MKKFKSIISVLMSFVLMLALTACSQNYEKKLEGSWYVEGSSTPVVTFFDDGTCKMDGEYGTGKWAVVNDNQLKLSDFYGATMVFSIEELDNKKLVLNYNGDEVTFYKNSKVESSKQTAVDTTMYIEENSSDDNEMAESPKTTEKSGKLERGEKIYPTDIEFIRDRFSDGIAVVRFRMSKNDFYSYGVISQDGKITPISEEGSFSCNVYTTSEFYNGKCIVADDSALYSVSADGTAVILRNEKDTKYEYLCGGEGYYLVEQHVRSYSENTKKVAIVNENGEFIVAPCDLFGEIKIDDHKKICEKGYLGDSMFFINGILFNAKTKQSYDIGYDYKYCGEFYNGKTVLQNGNRVYSVSTDGELNKIIDLADNDFTVRYSKERILTVGRDGTVNLYDTKGDSVNYFESKFANLDYYGYFNYEEAYPNAEYNATTIIINGKDGNNYIALLDDNGFYIIEPIKLYNYNSQLIASNYGEEKVFACVITEDDYLYFSIISSDGTITILDNLKKADFEVEYIEDIWCCNSKFQNGIMIVHTNNKDVLLKADGQIIKPYLVQLQ